MKIETKLIHVGGSPDKETGAVMPPIFQTSTYAQKEPGVHSGYEYTRSHNPTRTRLEECLASLEEAKFSLVTSSGLAAETLILHSLPKDSLIFSSDDLYGGSYRLFTKVFHEKFRYAFEDTTNTKRTIEEIKRLRPTLVWLESPTNPTLKISDIEAIAKASHEVGALVLVDNTFMSPYFQRPITLGADIVLHSMTKYLNGHSDVVGGVVMLNDKSLYDKLWFLQNATGPCQSPFDSWLILRGLKTLAIRMKRHEENALVIAKFLETHPKVERVIYPGLPSHPQHELAKKQMSGFSGMITFFIKGGLTEGNNFLKKLKLFTLAESLGGVESLVDHPAIMTHASVPAAIRKSLGIEDNLIRLSVGIEEVTDLISDLKSALQ